MDNSAIIFILILIGAVILIISRSAKNAKEKRAEEEKRKEESGLKVNIPGVEKAKKPEAKGNKANQKSLDMLYAEVHGMWSCPHCETLNDEMTLYCSACGAKK